MGPEEEVRLGARVGVRESHGIVERRGRSKGPAGAERRPLGHEFLMRSEEALIGTSVGVLDGGRRSGKGRFGTIERTYGHPDYLAVEVRFEDGSVELHWYHELRAMKRQPLP